MNRTTHIVFDAFKRMNLYDQEYDRCKFQLQSNGLSDATRALLADGMQYAAWRRGLLHRFIERMGRVSAQ
jgi:hypothetical protein